MQKACWRRVIAASEVRKSPSVPNEENSSDLISANRRDPAVASIRPFAGKHYRAEIDATVALG